jgi:hypothetical protein
MEQIENMDYIIKKNFTSQCLLRGLETDASLLVIYNCKLKDDL